MLKRSFIRLLVLLGGVGGVRPAAAQCSGKNSDNSFPAIATSAGFPEGSHAFEFRVSRVVSPDVDASGLLLNPATDIQNGIVSQYAYLSYLGVFDINGSAGGSVVNLYLNGVHIADEPVTQMPQPDCIKVPIQNVRFGQRVPGQAPTLGVNVIDVFFDGTTISDQFVQLGNLSFQAIAPIVLVHGWNSGPWEWGRSPQIQPFVRPTNVTHLTAAAILCKD